MKNFLIILSIFLFIYSCKKEECSEIEPYQPYVSTMKGQNGSDLRCSVIYVATSVVQGCDGWFLHEIYSSPSEIEFSGFNMQIVEGLPDSIKQWNVYNEGEFIVDFAFISTGYECAYSDGLGDLLEPPKPYPVELISITKIEIAP